MLNYINPLQFPSWSTSGFLAGTGGVLVWYSTACSPSRAYPR